MEKSSAQCTAVQRTLFITEVIIALPSSPTYRDYSKISSWRFRLHVYNLKATRTTVVVQGSLMQKKPVTHSVPVSSVFTGHLK